MGGSSVNLLLIDDEKPDNIQAITVSYQNEIPQPKPLMGLDNFTNDIRFRWKQCNKSLLRLRIYNRSIKQP